MTDQIIAVTVLGDDRPGIVADVTGALAGLHGNLEDSTMTLLRGHFAMVCSYALAPAPTLSSLPSTPSVPMVRWSSTPESSVTPR